MSITGSHITSYLNVTGSLDHRSKVSDGLWLVAVVQARTGLTSDDITTVRATIGHLRQTLFSVLEWAPIAALVRATSAAILLHFGVGNAKGIDLSSNCLSIFWQSKTEAVELGING